MRWYALRYQGNLPALGRRRAYLGGVICDACGATWATTGIVLPEVGFFPEGTEEPRANPWGVYARRRDELIAREPWVRDIIAPGASLGPFRFRRILGRLPSCWTDVTDGVYLRANAWLAMQRAAVRVRAVPVDAGVPGSQGIMDLVLPLHGEQPHERYLPRPPPCRQCGRTSPQGVGWHGAIRAASIPEGLDAFRLADHTTIVVVSEAFRDALRREPLDAGLRFDPIDLA